MRPWFTLPWWRRAIPSPCCSSAATTARLLREALAYASVEQVVLTSIDEELVDILVEHLPSGRRAASTIRGWNSSLRTPPTTWRARKKTFDVIIADLSEFDEAGSPFDLQSEEFYRQLNARLAPGGVVVVHGVDFDTANCSNYLAYRRAIAEVFPVVKNYTALVPSLRGETMYMVASHSVDPANLTPNRDRRPARARRPRRRSPAPASTTTTPTPTAACSAYRRI